VGILDMNKLSFEQRLVKRNNLRLKPQKNKIGLAKMPHKINYTMEA
jgi:hypothetical protein